MKTKITESKIVKNFIIETDCADIEFMYEELKLVNTKCLYVKIYSTSEKYDWKLVDGGVSDYISSKEIACRELKNLNDKYGLILF